MKSIEQIRAEDPGNLGTPVYITSVDIPFWDLVALAIKLAVIWVAFGAIGYGIYVLIN